jgi:hypothetical protein
VARGGLRVPSPSFWRVNMPGMPRWDKKSIKIAYKIMGVPANIRSEANKSKEQKERDKRLTFEQTARVR